MSFRYCCTSYSVDYGNDGWLFFKEKENFNAEKVRLESFIMLIFTLGFSIGSKSELLAVMPKVGLNAAVLLTMALLFSILFVKAARKLVKI
jgi:hypothetical protein